MNKWIGMGRLTRDPEIRLVGNDISICNFTIAVDRKYKKDDGSPTADFINCVAFRKTAEFIEKYFGKGKMIAVVGSIQTRTWDDDDGERHYITEVLVDEVNFCGDGSGSSSADSSAKKKGAAKSGNKQKSKPSPPPADEDEDDDDLPW